MNSQTPRLTVNGVSRSFGRTEVLSDVSFSVMQGEVVCLLGPSGCGKSTTLRIISGIDRQQSGSICIDGEAVSDRNCHKPPEARSVGFLFQDFALFPHITVAENIGFGLTSRGAARAERIEELLRKVRLTATRDRYPHELSGGEQQRVALARALAPRPKIMLMDEPFSNLDNRLRDDIRDESLSLLREETAVVLVTHEPAEAMHTGDRIALMRKGRIVQVDTPYEIYNNPADREAAEFFSELNLVHGIVRAGSVETPFGRFPAPGLVDGADVEIMTRPQHMRIDFDRDGSGPVPTEMDGVAARGVVERARYMGNASLVEFRVEFDDSVLKAMVPSVFLPRSGMPLWLSIRRGRHFLFPCSVQSRVASPYSEDGHQVSGRPASPTA